MRKPSSFSNKSLRPCSSVGVSGGVMSGTGLKRLGCASGAGVLPFDDFVRLRSGCSPRGGVPGSVKWIVLGRNLMNRIGLV
jgi:hypothetical protein